MVTNVLKAYDELGPRSLNENFLSLHKHIECAMRAGEGNKYREPHMHKKSRRNSGEDIERTICDRAAYDHACATLQDYNTGNSSTEQAEGTSPTIEAEV